MGVKICVQRWQHFETSLLEISRTNYFLVKSWLFSQWQLPFRIYNQVSKEANWDGRGLSREEGVSTISSILTTYVFDTKFPKFCPFWTQSGTNINYCLSYRQSSLLDFISRTFWNLEIWNFGIWILVSGFLWIWRSDLNVYDLNVYDLDFWDPDFWDLDFFGDWTLSSTMSPLEERWNKPYCVNVLIFWKILELLGIALVLVLDVWLILDAATCVLRTECLITYYYIYYIHPLWAPSWLSNLSSNFL